MKLLYPKKIILNENIKNICNIKKPCSLQIGLNESKTFILKANAKILLDFGEEVVGSIRILTYKTSKSGKVRIVFGESVSECLSTIGEYNSTNDHSTRDMIVKLEDLSDMIYGNTGFRFVLLETIDNSEVELKKIIALNNAFSFPAIGSFKCDNDVINNIFETATNTLRLCIQNNMIWDGIKRDRLVWAGDLHPEILGILYLFGDLDNIKNSLLFVKEETKKGKWINNIPSYSLWWIICLFDYYMFTKNTDFVLDQLEYVIQIVKQLDKSISSDGQINYGFNFINWDMYTNDKNDKVKINDEEASLHALSIISLQKAKILFEIFNFKTELCDNILKRLKSKEYKVSKYMASSAFRVFAGIDDENDKNILLQNNLETFSTFMSYYIMKARNKFKYNSKTIDMLIDYYQAMLDLGSTTFWEQFDYNWKDNALKVDQIPNKCYNDIYKLCGKECYRGYRKSLCHGWSCGPIQYLFEVVGGIKIVEAGCKEIEVNPTLFNLNYIDIVFPTPYGNISITHKKINGKIQTNYSCPKEVKLNVINN